MTISLLTVHQDTRIVKNGNYISLIDVVGHNFSNSCRTKRWNSHLLFGGLFAPWSWEIDHSLFLKPKVNVVDVIAWVVSFYVCEPLWFHLHSMYTLLILDIGSVNYWCELEINFIECELALEFEWNKTLDITLLLVFLIIG